MTENQPVNKMLLRHSLLFCFKLGETAAEAHRKLCQAFGQDVMSERSCREWFRRFKSGDMDVEDKPHTGRPIEIDKEKLKAMIEADPKLTTRELADMLSTHYTTVDRHLKSLGKVSKLGQLVPHELTDFDKNRRIMTCGQLLSYRRTREWLKTLVTGDEKWVSYVNVRRKRQWLDKQEKPEPTPKAGPHEMKIMLCIWWDFKGIILWELLPHNITVNSDLYCAQLDRLNAEIKKKRPEMKKVRFLHDNARPHTAKKTMQKLLEQGWEVMPHPAYSPDLAPSDYHLFRSLQNHLNEKHFVDEDEVKSYLCDYFNSLSSDFCSSGIFHLPKRWQQVIDSDGNYILDE
jgi:[histone H3]-lysine36 N-dimethyltransferase SETMAR